MSRHRRSSRKLAIIALAVPVIAAVYLAAVAQRMVGLPRALLAGALGATVIGSVYADETYRRAPAGLRRGVTFVLTIALLATSAHAAPVSASKPAEAVIQAARGYVGAPYRWGATGPASFAGGS